MKKAVWVSSWDRVCGIADYSKVLLPALRATAGERMKIELVSLDEFRNADEVASQVQRLDPDLIHFQHEYGLYGGKNPPGYWFPTAIDKIRRSVPRARIVATAHTVLSEQYRFPVAGRGLQMPARWLANRFLLPSLRRVWGRRTWGRLDAGVVHSGLQTSSLRSSGCPVVEVIPHFVPEATRAEHLSSEPGTVLVFGFITPEKGQDVVISAISRLPKNVKLVLAGGVRRHAEEKYRESLMDSIEKSGLQDRVEITGFVKSEDIDVFYGKASLVVAPFRETTGSGSLAQALSRGASILASDLPLNKEIVERVPGSVEFFKSEDPEDCARKIEELLENSDRRANLSRHALEYAGRYRPARIAESHLDLYERLFLPRQTGT